MGPAPISSYTPHRLLAAGVPRASGRHEFSPNDNRGRNTNRNDTMESIGRDGSFHACRTPSQAVQLPGTRGPRPVGCRIFSVPDFAIIADWASILGFAVSIVGACITLWVALRLRKIEQHYMRQALFPNYLRKLGGQLKNLENSFRTNNPRQAAEALAFCQSILGDLLPYSGGRFRRASGLIQTIKVLRQSASDATFLAQCEELNTDLKALLDSLKSYQSELKWRRRDAK